MATSSGHNSHHQAIAQKLTKAGTYSANVKLYEISLTFVLTFQSRSADRFI
jgi:hypothetical protein